MHIPMLYLRMRCLDRFSGPMPPSCVIHSSMLHTKINLPYGAGEKLFISLMTLRISWFGSFALCSCSSHRCCSAGCGGSCVAC